MFEIGNSLREARLRKGLEFAEAEQVTKIRGKYLRALEEERFELLPAQTYVKGFLRSYAEYLGLDGQLYVDEYNSRYVVGEDELSLRPRRTRPTRAQRRVESRVLLVALFGIATATALVVIAWQWGSPEAQKVRTPPAATPPVATTPETSEPEVRTTPANAWITLDLRATGAGSYVIVKRGGPGGKELDEATLEAGQRRTYVGKVIWIQAASPENLVAKIDGRRVTLPPSGAEPLVALVTRRGISAAS